jgi:copper chaperone CopZ
MSDDAALTLVVAELDCADEAAQIEGALGCLPAVTGVRTSVGAHKVFVTCDPAQSDPARIRATIESLGMTVGMDQPAASARRTPLSTVLGGLFVTAVALVALVGIRPGAGRPPDVRTAHRQPAGHGAWNTGRHRERRKPLKTNEHGGRREARVLPCSTVFDPFGLADP